MSAVRIKHVALYFLPVQTRMPLKFGAQVVTKVTCARAKVVIENAAGRCAEGWGETPLSVAWVWPSETATWDQRENHLRAFCESLVRRCAESGPWSHPMEWGCRMTSTLDTEGADLPLLAKLCCLSLFDLAVWDAFGVLLGRPVFELLEIPLEPMLGDEFRGQVISHFLPPPVDRLPVWHLVGGLDPLEPSELTGSEPDDGYPVLLRDWIRRDGLRCLKVKLRGTDAGWDYARYVQVGRIAAEEGVTALSADFNCTVTDPAYVCDFLDRLLADHAEVHGLTLYIEQPFPYDLEAHQIDARPVSARKPLFLDESAHDWKHVRMGRDLGWNGVALKTCKTLTGALLSLCWARRHGMGLMVQDLTNPMLAQIPHVTLAAHAGTLRGVECNAMQFYPEASKPEEKIHPGLFRRRDGVLDLSTLGPTGFGYRVEEIGRELPEAAVEV
jgi:L-alanine-DL-glutamate epimerase-like enolase superfamily enzyme